MGEHQLPEEWQPTVEAVRTQRGAEDFVAALREAPADLLAAAWEAVRRLDRPQVGRVERLKADGRRQLIRKTLDKWRRGEVTLTWAAGTIRLAVASAPQEIQPWQRPPFQQGHLAGVRHGALTPRLVAPEVAAMEAWIIESHELLDTDAHPLDALLVEDLAWNRVQIRRVREELDRHGVLDAVGHPREAAQTLHRLEGRSLHLMTDLGIGPAARARLMADKAAGARDAAQGMAEVERLRIAYGGGR